MSTWSLGNEDDDIRNNEKAADRVFSMLLCERIFVLKKLVDQLPPNDGPESVRRRWTFLQIAPARLRLDNDDIFATLLQLLRAADTDEMLRFVRDTIRQLMISRRDLFPKSDWFVVVDEAQHVATMLNGRFRSITIRDRTAVNAGRDYDRDTLHALHRFLYDSAIFKGSIISGTGLSMGIVKSALSSLAAKFTGNPQVVVTDLGIFSKGDTSHEIYIRRFLGVANANVSDKRLLERILYWYSGRCVYHTEWFSRC